MERILASKMTVLCLGTLVCINEQSKESSCMPTVRRMPMKKTLKKSFPWNEKVGGMSGNQMSISKLLVSGRLL